MWVRGVLTKAVDNPLAPPNLRNTGNALPEGARSVLSKTEPV